MYQIVLVLALMSFSAQAYYVPSALSLDRGSTELSSEVEYFDVEATTNYEGQKQNLFEGTTYSQVDIDTNFYYGLTSNLELGLGARYRMIQATDIIDSESLSFNRGDLESTSIKFKYAFKGEDQLRYALLGGYSHPMYANSQYGGGVPAQIALGEGSRSYYAGLSVNYKSMARNHMGFTALYRSPSEFNANEIVMKSELAIEWPAFTFLGGLEYISSRNNDAYSNDPENKPQIYQGPSAIYNSVDRTYSAPYVGFNFKMGTRWRAEFKYQRVASGTSTSLGEKVLFTIARRTFNKRSFAAKDKQFKQYRMEGIVTKVSKTRKSVMVDLGLTDGLKKGMVVDFYYFDYLGGNQLIASGRAIKVGPTKSLIKVLQRYSKRRVEKGIRAKSGLI